jgi:hypothetical protein
MSDIISIIYDHIYPQLFTKNNDIYDIILEDNDIEIYTKFKKGPLLTISVSDTSLKLLNCNITLNLHDDNLFQELTNQISILKQWHNTTFMT